MTAKFTAAALLPPAVQECELTEELISTFLQVKPKEAVPVRPIIQTFNIYYTHNN